MLDSLYIGEDYEVWAENHTFSGWSDFLEWLQDGINPWYICTIQCFNGPGSMLSTVVTFKRQNKLLTRITDYAIV